MQDPVTAPRDAATTTPGMTPAKKKARKKTAAKKPKDPVDLVARQNLQTTKPSRFPEGVQLKLALARWTCPRCGLPVPNVYKTEGLVRRVKCRNPDCGKTGKIVLSRYVPPKRAEET